MALQPLKAAATFVEGSREKLKALAAKVSQPDQGPLCGQEVRIVAEMEPTHWVGQEGTAKTLFRPLERPVRL